MQWRLPRASCRRFSSLRFGAPSVKYPHSLTAPFASRSQGLPRETETVSRTGMRRAARPRGFSLVEVVLALGIITFAFVPLLGMLPLGLDFSRQAIDTTVAAQIAQQLTTEAQQTDFSRLPELATASVADPFYFDDQGNKTADIPGAIYKAVYDISPSTELPDNVSTGKLATVTICILNTKANRTSQEADLIKNPDSRKIIALIPDNGR
jgi:uncharacterized protein (TIGR02598 family)